MAKRYGFGFGVVSPTAGLVVLSFKIPPGFLLVQNSSGNAVLSPSGNVLIKEAA